MGMFDTFESPSADKCTEGHVLKRDWQTKALDCALAHYKVGDALDPLNRSSLVINDGQVYVYQWCEKCQEMYERAVIINGGEVESFAIVRKEGEV